MNAIAIVLSLVSVGTREVSGRLSAHSCWVFSTKQVNSSMSASVRASPTRSAMSLWIALRHTARMRSRNTPGKDGQRRNLKAIDAFLVHRVGGATVKICHGNHCDRIWL